MSTLCKCTLAENRSAIPRCQRLDLDQRSGSSATQPLADAVIRHHLLLWICPEAANCSPLWRPHFESARIHLKTKRGAEAPRLASAKPFFPNSRRHPETDGFYQAGMTSLDLPRVVELIVAIVGMCSASIFLALAIDPSQLESAEPKPPGPDA